MALAPLQRAFLAAYPTLGTVGGAAAAAGISRVTHWRWMTSDTEYAEAFAAAKDEFVEVLEVEARRRAADGTLEPVFFKGEQCGEIRKYSDTLMIFLLKANRPDKYRDEVRIITESEIDAELRRLEATLGAGHPSMEGSATR